MRQVRLMVLPMSTCRSGPPRMRADGTAGREGLVMNGVRIVV